jgi:hypothetical protein
MSTLKHGEPRLRVGGVFSSTDGVRFAISRVRREHPNAGVELRSSAPPPKDLEHSLLAGTRSKVLWAAITGGLLGGIGAFSLASLSAIAYPLATGGMEIIAGPPVGIITYEGTALGAILCTVAAVLLEGRIWRRARFEDPLAHHLVAGRWVLWIDDAKSANGDTLRGLMREVGALEVVSLEA